MLAAKQDKAQQELPKSICQPWHVSCRFIRMGLAFPNNGPEQVSKRESANEANMCSIEGLIA